MKFDRCNDKFVQFESIQFLVTENIPENNKQEKYRALHNCISTLNESDKAIIVLYLEELPYKEIATITGLTEKPYCS